MTASHHGIPRFLRVTTKIALTSPEVTPADKSISATNKINTKPIARIMSGADCCNRLAKFKLVKNTGLKKEKRTTNTKKPIIAGSAPMRP
ncbi:unannotated protein [freshwater metagenome]|uniref:Unannotated protein n=1 Tax=freshwater metagenome TaxID=449393 RepID=A0A6J6WQ57_9ZZZZ